MIPEIWSATDNFFFSFWTIFCLFTPPSWPHSPNNPENQNFEKMKKTPGYIIISHSCTMNDNHMIYGSWDMKHDRQTILWFWASFCPLSHQQPKKLKFWKNERNETPGDIILHKWNQKAWSCYTFPEIWQVTDVFFIFHFGLLLVLLLTKNPQNQNSEKIKKKETPGDNISLHKCSKNQDHMLYCSWDITRYRCYC